MKKRVLMVMLSIVGEIVVASQAPDKSTIVSDIKGKAAKRNFYGFPMKNNTTQVTGRMILPSGTTITQYANGTHTRHSNGAVIHLDEE